MVAGSCAGHEDNGIIDDNTPSKLFNLDLLIAKVGISSQYLRNVSLLTLWTIFNIAHCARLLCAWIVYLMKNNFSWFALYFLFGILWSRLWSDRRTCVPSDPASSLSDERFRVARFFHTRESVKGVSVVKNSYHVTLFVPVLVVH